MFIPLRTNRPPRKRPAVTSTIILVNMIVFTGGLAASAFGIMDRFDVANAGHLVRGDFHVWQLITYQFIHDPTQIWHLAFNMLFLWIFGCAVEDRLGRASFLAFYLMGGVMAGLAHMMVSPAPVIGASGAIAATTGAFLALFPRARIQILLVFFIIGIYSIPAIWFVAFVFAIDVLRQIGAFFGRGDNVAYAAHIAGYVYGFSLAFTLLALNIVKREEFDIFFLFKQWRRRAAFRAAMQGGPKGQVWDAPVRTAPPKDERPAPPEPIDPRAEAIALTRSRIRTLLADHDLEGAVTEYRRLLDLDDEAVLPESNQLDIANQLNAKGDALLAARAYEGLLARYPACRDAPQVRLLLALLYVRRIAQPERAKALIERARSSLTDPAERALADELLAEIST